VNVAIALFYAFYRLFFYKDTFFQLRRLSLLAFFLISFLYPLLNIQEWIKEQEPMSEIATIYATMLPEVSTTAKVEFFFFSVEFLSQLFFYIYLSGIVIFSAHFFIQLSRITILAFRSKKKKINGITVKVLTKQDGPFSFFKWIFICPGAHNNKELDEILTHELTHVRQYHSIDVITSEVVTIICWINPFVWLLKREVRHNLEYMADNKVIHSGHDTQTYQYHLLGLAHHKAAANLYNSFNVLPLKNRITMMNKKRTRNIGKTKYLMFIPLAALLMLVSNIEAVARVTGKIVEKIMPGSLIDNNSVDISPDYTQDLIAMANDTIKNKSGKEKVYSAVDQMPQFPGGDAALLQYIARNLIYPAKAQEAREEGKVYVRFTITEKGKVTDVIILRGVSPLLNNEAIRVIKSLPDWTPGKHKGKIVSVYYVVPISFTLDNSTPKEGKSEKNEVVVVGYGPSKGGTKEPVYTAVEQMPQYPGGIQALLEYIAHNLKYPVEAQKAKIEGKVYVRFIVSETGVVTNVEILKSLDIYCDKEAMRIVKSLPNWTPGKQNGVNVAVYYVIPINFQLTKDDSKTSLIKVTTSNGTKPLYIVDGKEVTEKEKQDLNPESIESINILKDKSAIEVYGDKGKNGVIAITLKKK